MIYIPGQYGDKFYFVQIVQIACRSEFYRGSSLFLDFLTKKFICKN